MAARAYLWDKAGEGECLHAARINPVAPFRLTFGPPTAATLWCMPTNHPTSSSSNSHLPRRQSWRGGAPFTEPPGATLSAPVCFLPATKVSLLSASTLPSSSAPSPSPPPPPPPLPDAVLLSPLVLVSGLGDTSSSVSLSLPPVLLLPPPPLLLLPLLVW